MQMTISGHHVEVTEALRGYVESKFEKVERHYDKITIAEVILTVEPNEQKAEVTLHLAGDTLHASAVHNDMYKAIDNLTDKIDKQVRRRKDRLTNHHADSKQIDHRVSSDDIDDAELEVI
jgi:putative sigma-54 modulation protein